LLLDSINDNDPRVGGAFAKASRLLILRRTVAGECLFDVWKLYQYRARIGFFAFKYFCESTPGEEFAAVLLSDVHENDPVS
jgi:hypothetical protein